MHSQSNRLIAEASDCIFNSRSYALYQDRHGVRRDAMSSISDEYLRVHIQP